MTTADKSMVFRVTGLPSDQNENQLRTWLEGVIDEKLQQEERSRIQVRPDFVPSCQNSHEALVALVEIMGGVPQFLSALMRDPLGEWGMETDKTDLHFDRHFFGLTQLYATESGQPVNADVIAIAGLDGHAYGSWRGKGNLGKMWLRDFLSKDLPRCRTMTYGYNSKLSSHGVGTILDYGREFMQEIESVRYTKECLVKAVQAREEEHPYTASLYNATYGILFFATPHKGLVVEDMTKMLNDEPEHPRHALLQEIDENSKILSYQLSDFKNLVRDRKIVSFLEMEQTRKLKQKLTEHRWERTGDYMTAVKPDSAMLQLPDMMEDKIPVHADHSRIVKFDSPSSTTYRRALNKLREFEHDALKVVPARFCRSAGKEYLGLDHLRRTEAASVDNNIYIWHSPKPSSTVPFAKDDDFVDRSDIMARIDASLSNAVPPGRKALVGFGGFGKSQIAIEYSYRFRDKYPQTWVLWVHGSNGARFQQSYDEIAGRLELPGREHPNVNVLRLVYSWLCDERNGRWLMILDNVDDEDVLFGQKGKHLSMEVSPKSGDSGKPLSTFIPQNSNGSILVTSRNRLAALKLVGSPQNIIDVDQMDEHDAMALLSAKVAVEDSDRRDATLLLQNLGHIPLAISQTAAYINARAPRMTIAKYLALFREDEANRTRLLDEDMGDLRRDPSVPNAVSKTWQISFDQIRKISPSAADLFSLMCLFDPQGIPEFLLSGMFSNELDFEDALAPLLSFSLIKAETRQQAFDIHPLVHLATKKWLGIRGELEKWQQESIRHVSDGLRSLDFEDLRPWEALEPHVETVLRYNDSSPPGRLRRATILCESGDYIWYRGNPRAAETRIEEALSIRGELLEPFHIDTLNSMHTMFLVHTSLERFETARKQAVKLMESCKQLPSEHPFSLVGMESFAILLRRQAEWEEEERVLTGLLEIAREKHGPEHSFTLKIMTDLAATHREQGRLEEPEKQLLQVIETQKSLFGCENLDTAVSMTQLGITYQAQKRWKEAEKIIRQALEIQTRLVGRHDPETLHSMNLLVSIYRCQDKWEEAEKLKLEILEAQKKTLEQDYMASLSWMARLATVWRQQGRDAEAMDLLKQVESRQREVLGSENPYTKHSRKGLERWQEEDSIRKLKRKTCS